MRTKPSDSKAESETATASAPEEAPAASAEGPPEEASAEPAAVAPAAKEPVLTVEDWAARKKMLPKFVDVAAPFARKGRAAPRKELNPLFLSFAQAQAHFSWPIGKELTEAEFDAAVVTATTNIYR